MMIHSFRKRTWIGLSVTFILAAAAVCLGQSRVQKISAQGAASLGAIFAPKPRQHPPDWAQIEQDPLFTFAWASDFHLDGSRLEFIAEALQYVDEELKPDFLMITGDNNAYPAPVIDPKSPQPLSLRRQRFLKTYLQKHLKTPYVIIPGDNWPHDFDKVFGPAQYSFDYGGLHFMFTAPDRSFHGAGGEGLSVFDEPTWEWMRRDLDASRKKPVIVITHEPVFPPTFLDAKRLGQLLDEHPNVLAGFHGHIHVDMEFNSNGRAHLLCPALGPTPRPAMKLARVYRHVIILRTVEYDKAGGRFEMANKWQKIDVPPSLRGGPAEPQAKRFAMKSYDSAPAHPHRDAPELADRLGDLTAIVQEFLGSDLPRLLLERALAP